MSSLYYWLSGYWWVLAICYSEYLLFAPTQRVLHSIHNPQYCTGACIPRGFSCKVRASSTAGIFVFVRIEYGIWNIQIPSPKCHPAPFISSVLVLFLSYHRYCITLYCRWSFALRCVAHRPERQGKVIPNDKVS